MNQLFHDIQIYWDTCISRLTLICPLPECFVCFAKCSRFQFVLSGLPSFDPAWLIWSLEFPACPLIGSVCLFAWSPGSEPHSACPLYWLWLPNSWVSWFWPCLKPTWIKLTFFNISVFIGSNNLYLWTSQLYDIIGLNSFFNQARCNFIGNKKPGDTKKWRTQLGPERLVTFRITKLDNCLCCWKLT